MEGLKVPFPWKLVLWPGLWVPLVILVCGLLTTGIAASIESSRARDLAEARYHAQHQALVNLLLAHAPARISGTTDTSVWLQSLFDEVLPPALGLRIDTLDRHTKVPLFQAHTNGAIDPTRSLRTEVSPGDVRWMLTTVPSSWLLEEAAQKAGRTIWITGLALCTTATLLTLLLCRRLYMQSLQIIDLSRGQASAEGQVNNLQVEKSVLRQALNDSEQRSRDLVALSGAMICELDESGQIGFISAQIADLLNRAPTDMTGQAFESLVVPSSRENFRRTLEASRKDHSIERIDLSLVHQNTETLVPVTLRIRSLKDPVYGFNGYRISALP
ncbi:histidine kinase [Marinobacter salinus]|uniref:Histidine kinase n=1 Tax=Marinobacter salinus TaxID=1874317 RepID=A0A1D9GPN4_9GAMM|nr:PAS domain-containing protein [Marinobacter salinus]AOY89587.1 histidine kinase [Marinobacter salinus]